MKLTVVMSIRVSQKNELFLFKLIFIGVPNKVEVCYVQNCLPMLDEVYNLGNLFARARTKKSLD